MLKEPRPEDVRRNLGEDTPLLLVLLARRIVVFLARALATTDTRVTRVTCNNKRTAKVITCRLGNLRIVFSTLHPRDERNNERPFRDLKNGFELSFYTSDRANTRNSEKSNFIRDYARVYINREAFPARGSGISDAFKPRSDFRSIPWWAITTSTLGLVPMHTNTIKPPAITRPPSTRRTPCTRSALSAQARTPASFPPRRHPACINSPSFINLSFLIAQSPGTRKAGR